MMNSIRDDSERVRELMLQVLRLFRSVEQINVDSPCDDQRPAAGNLPRVRYRRANDLSDADGREVVDDWLLIVQQAIYDLHKLAAGSRSDVR